MVSTFISRVARVRSRPGRAALMAKFMAASSRRPCTPAWTMPWGLQAGRGRGERAVDPAEVLAVDPVVVEGRPDRADELHAAVAQPAVHVLDPTRHRPDRSAGLVTAAVAGPRRPRSDRSSRRVRSGRAVLTARSSSRRAPAPQHPTTRARPAGTVPPDLGRRATMTDAVIVDAVRTPGGKRNGKLRNWHAADLGSEPLKALVERNDLDPGPGRRRDHGLRHAGRRAVAQRRPQRRAGRRLPRVGARPPPSTASAAPPSRPCTSAPRASSPAPTTWSSAAASRS